jgi:hypothetical protein
VNITAQDEHDIRADLFTCCKNCGRALYLG